MCIKYVYIPNKLRTLTFLKAQYKSKNYYILILLNTFLSELFNK